METTVLGRTGIEVSVAGLGAGGHSRIGKATGKSRQESIDLVKHAVELGISLIDSSERYGTEDIIGDALSGYRHDSVCISTKFGYSEKGRLRSEEELEKSLEGSLRRLQRDAIDVYHIHAVTPDWYERVRDRFYPVLEKQQKSGKIRFIGITELFGQDSSHGTLEKTVEDDLWDVVMVGFNILNPSARRLLPRMYEQGIGTLNMFAVRHAFQNLKSLERYLANMVNRDLIDLKGLEDANPFTEALSSSVCGSLTEMAYRFCRHEPGIDVVLTGTGTKAHLEENIRSIQQPKLPANIQKRLADIFGKVDGISGGEKL